MKKITFLFYNNKDIASFFIRMRLSTVFSHVAIRFEDNGLFHSSLMKGTHRDDTYAPEPVFTSTIEVSEAGYAEALAFVHGAVGSPYDFTAILGFIAGNKTNKDTSYFCSELGREIFERATGIKLGYYNLVTPGQLRLMTETYRLVAEK